MSIQIRALLGWQRPDFAQIHAILCTGMGFPSIAHRDAYRAVHHQASDDDARQK